LEVAYDLALIERAGLLPYQQARYDELSRELAMLSAYAAGLMDQLFEELDREATRKLYPLAICCDCIGSHFGEVPSSTPPLLYPIGTLLTTQ